MKNKFFILIIASLPVFISCNDDADETTTIKAGTTQCTVQPYYLGQTGLNRKAAVLSTSEKKIKGLVLVEYNQDGNSISIGKTWQHPSWSQHGWLGPIATDGNGNSYVAPVPVISVLDNPVNKQNIIYKVDSRTAEMNPLISLPIPDTTTVGNPYGLLGLFYDCDVKLLYASSVAGSDKDHEKGVIYTIDPEKGVIIDKLEGVDAMGLCIGGVKGERRLYFGSSRYPLINSIAISSTGKFSGKVAKEISLDMLGPRGDDKARRIRFDNTGVLQVFGIEFNYNLTAASEKQESVYYFDYSAPAQTWTRIIK